MKKVTIIISRFYPKIGGAETQLKLIATELAQRGYDVEVIARKYEGLSSKDEIDNVKIKRIPIIKFNPILEKLSFYLNSVAYILTQKKKPQSIIAVQTGSEAAIALTVKKIIKCQVNIRIAGGELKLFKGKEDLFQKKFKNVDNFVILNKDMKKNLKELGEFSTKHITNAVLPPKETNSNLGEYVLFCGRIETVKGPELLLQGFDKMYKNNIQIPLVIVGDGTQRERLETQYSHLTNVKWVGEQHDTDKYYKDARILINTSEYEGISNTILEGLSYGIPIIATKVGGNVEIVKHQQTGLLIDENVDQVYEAVSNIYYDEKMLKEMKKNALDYIKQHDISNIVDKYVQVFGNRI